MPSAGRTEGWNDELSHYLTSPSQKCIREFLLSSRFTITIRLVVPPLVRVHDEKASLAARGGSHLQGGASGRITGLG